jgi:hypothetical protein
MAAAEAPVIQSLKVIVLEGQNAIHDLTRKIYILPVVEIRDENDRPLEGAEVVFRLPATGPGGFFANQETSRKARSNPQGQASAVGFVPNSQAGSYKINVTAMMGNRMGTAVINQTNSLDAAADQRKSSRSIVKGRSTKFWTIAALVAAGAVGGGAYAATRGGGSSTPSSAVIPNPTIVINPGAPIVGGLR